MMSIARLFLLVFGIATVLSFVINFLIAVSMSEDYLHHEIWYYGGSLLASSTTGAIFAIIATIAMRRIYRISN